MSENYTAQTVTAGVIDPSVLAAYHTYTTACDGLHAPGPCPVKPPVQTLIVGPDGFAVEDAIPGEDSQP
jgi:hypothetical protein